MMQIRPLRDKVLGRMLEPIGQDRTTKGGVIVVEKNMEESGIRPRWFEVTHVGPDQVDVAVGQYILMPHGRWSRGVDIEGSRQINGMIFLLDNDSILGISDDNPLEPAA
jgi:co-chaperonin GroES (HSP10)